MHPTGLVKIDDADAKVKFLAAEALRGVGGVLIDKTGNRFCNELGRRDYVSGMMWKNQPPFRLCLNSKASKEIHWHCEHYKGRGVMKGYANMQALCDETGIKPDVLKKTLDDHTEIGKKVEASPDQGPYDAYPYAWANCDVRIIASVNRVELGLVTYYVEVESAALAFRAMAFMIPVITGARGLCSTHA